MKHLVIYRRPNGQLSWTEVERDMPAHEFSNPGTYNLPSDMEIICVIHNIKPECNFTLVNKLTTTPQDPQKTIPLPPPAQAKLLGYEGSACPECMNFTMVRNGTCLKCDTCGSTTGCS